MQINRTQFMEEGYLVLREVVPRDELAALRESYELMVSRQREIWAKKNEHHTNHPVECGKLRHNPAYNSGVNRSRTC